MGIRDILKDGEPALRAKSRHVTDFDARLWRLIDDMWETMTKADGCGLAAPQVGILKQIAVVEAHGEKFELINPVVVCAEGEQIGAEGCLSVPGESAYVKRPQKIVVEFFDRHGKPQKETVEGFSARACSHEIDHLNGVMYYDKKMSEAELKKYGVLSS